MAVAVAAIFLLFALSTFNAKSESEQAGDSRLLAFVFSAFVLWLTAAR